MARRTPFWSRRWPSWAPSLWDRGLGQALEAPFDEDLRRSREVRLEEWRRRGSFQRLKERLASLLAEQF